MKRSNIRDIIILSGVLIVAISFYLIFKFGLIDNTPRFIQKSTNSQKNISDIGAPTVSRSQKNKLDLNTPTVSLKDLQTAELPNGDISIKNIPYKFEIVVPVTYNLSGNPSNFAVSFHGPTSGEPGPHDFSSISFRIQPLNHETLKEEVEFDYYESTSTQGETMDYKQIKSIILGQVSGFYYSCPFLVEQKCIYLPLDKDGEYLFILTSLSDDSGRGYREEIDNILTSLIISH